MARETMDRKASSAKRSGSEGASACTWRLHRSAGLQILTCPSLEKVKWLHHAFSTRLGGESELSSDQHGGKSAGNVLNLGFAEWDAPARVEANRKKFLEAIGAKKMRLITLKQIHSDIARAVDDAALEATTGDALITAEPGLLLAVETADCVPILLADPRRRAVAAIHAGWRGTLKRIASKVLGRMQMEFGTRPEGVVAVLGPAIGRCCYDVGPDVVKEFANQFPGAHEWFDGPYAQLAEGEEPNPLAWLAMTPPGHVLPLPKAQLDLRAANRAILMEAGVAPKNIFATDLCTACRTDLFFSHRRERTTGRLMAAIGISS